MIRFLLGMRTYRCSVCGNNRFKLVMEKSIKVSVRKCSKCGVICLNPRLSEKKYLRYYRADYWKDHHSLSFVRAEEIFNHLREYLTNDSKILEIGCGQGATLATLKRKGFYDLTGIEPVVEWCEELQGIKCFSQPLSEFKTKKRFDCIILSHTLEHFVEPQKALAKIRELLEDTGICYIKVPNRDSISDFNSQFDLPHCFYFNKSSLELLLKNQGLKIIKYYKSLKDEFTLFVKK